METRADIYIVTLVDLESDETTTEFYTSEEDAMEYASSMTCNGLSVYVSKVIAMTVKRLERV